MAGERQPLVLSACMLSVGLHLSYVVSLVVCYVYSQVCYECGRGPAVGTWRSDLLWQKTCCTPVVNGDRTKDCQASWGIFDSPEEGC
eukprot:1276919-Prymnesium_polylepis.1